jgi:hypothetical protein
LIPGRPPKRPGPSRTSRPGAASGLGAEARRDFRRNRMWSRLRARPKSIASGVEFEPLRRAGLSGCATVARQRQVHIGALRGATPEGQAFQRWPEPAVSQGTAEAGWFETVREGGGFDKRGFRQTLGSNTGEPVFRSPEGSPKRGQAALPITAGAWEARRTLATDFATV